MKSDENILQGAILIDKVTCIVYVNMEILIEEIVHKLHSLPEAKLQSVVDFVDFLTWHREPSRVKEAGSKDELSAKEDEELEAIADNLADEFEACVSGNVPILSDYAVSRAGIYEEHP